MFFLQKRGQLAKSLSLLLVMVDTESLLARNDVYKTTKSF